MLDWPRGRFADRVGEGQQAPIDVIDRRQAEPLQERRRDLHGRVVDAIESLHPDHLDEHVERLAHHAVRSERWEPALGYCREAGAKAFRRSANREAVIAFEQGLAALSYLPESTTTLERAIDLRFDLRGALFQLGEVERLADHLREAEALATALGDRRRLGQALCYLTNYRRVTRDLHRAVEAAGQ